MYIYLSPGLRQRVQRKLNRLREPLRRFGFSIVNSGIPQVLNGRFVDKQWSVIILAPRIDDVRDPGLAELDYVVGAG